MEFKEMHIVCENLEQRKQVMHHLTEIGYIQLPSGVYDYELCVATYDDGDFQTIEGVCNHKQINYKDFMENTQ